MSSTKEPRAYVEHELIGEIFGFLPTRIIDLLYDSLNVVIYNVMEGINERLIELRPEKETEIAEAIRKFEVDTDKEMDQLFNVFQQYIFNELWKIPDNLDVKPDYIKDIDITLTQEHEDRLDKQLEQTRREIVAQKKLQHFLKTKLRETELELSTVEEYSQHLSFFSTIPKEHDITDVEKSMEFVAENLNCLKYSVVESIKEYPKIKKKLDEKGQIVYVREHVADLLKNLK